MIAHIEFHGGCRDGKVVIGLDDVRLGPEKNPAHVYLCFTEGGRIGATFRETVPFAFRREQLREYKEKAAEAIRQGKPVPLDIYPPEHHVYLVADRRMEAGVLVIRMNYMENESRADGGEQSTYAEPASGESAKNVPVGPGRFERKPLVIDTMDDFRTMLVDPATARFGISSFNVLLPGVQPKFAFPKKKRELSAAVERRVRIIDAMTPVERRHPATLIDQFARTRIAKEARVSCDEVDRLVQVFEALTTSSASPSDQKDVAKGDPNSDSLNTSDLTKLPPQACVAFAARCALRACLHLELLDEEVNEVLRRAISITRAYVAGNAVSSDYLRKLDDQLWLADRLQWPDNSWRPERGAVRAASSAVSAASMFEMIEKFGFLASLDPLKLSPVALYARTAAEGAIAANDRNLTGILEDLRVLQEAVRSGEITGKTPVPLSFYTDPLEPRPG